MASFKKILAISFVSASLIVVPIRNAGAFVPIVIPWLLVGTNLVVADLVVGITGALTSVVWWDCNKFALSAPCTSKTPIPSAQQPKPAITISLAPDKKRENPDPAKFDDPQPGKRDVTAKISIGATSSGVMPTGPLGPGDNVDIGYYRQDPGDSNTQPDSYATMQYIAQKATASTTATGTFTGVIGVIIVKQPQGPDTATPFVAHVTPCQWNAALPTTDPVNQQQFIYCGQRTASENAQLEQRFPGTGRPKIPVRFAYSETSGSFYQGEVILHTDQSKPVTINCDAGYKLNQTDIKKCDLVTPSAVKKPTDTTCEVLYEPTGKFLMTDKLNPACDGLVDAYTMSVPGSNGTLDVSAKSTSGFSVCFSRTDGSKGCVDTGVYDPGTGGYVIVNSSVTPPKDPNNGMGCGGPGQGACAVVASADSDMYSKDTTARAGIDSAYTGLKGNMSGIPKDKFQWTFIPQIPTAACANPSVRNPVTGEAVEMNICGKFNMFSFFLNGVLALACVYGCVKQVQNALKA
jgi:hypothetical protein